LEERSPEAADVWSAVVRGKAHWGRSSSGPRPVPRPMFDLKKFHQESLTFDRKRSEKDSLTFNRSLNF